MVIGLDIYKFKRDYFTILQFHVVRVVGGNSGGLLVMKILFLVDLMRLLLG